MGCYDWENTPKLGDYIGCAIGSVSKATTVVLVTLSIVLFSILLVKTLLNRENPKVMPEILKQWQYLVLLPIVIVGGAAFALNTLFSLFGLPSISDWLASLARSLGELNQ